MGQLNRLHQIASQQAEAIGASPEQAFDRIGLILLDPLLRCWYDQAPLNAATFAHTGGDGVHFSFLLVNGELCDHSPVVMTSPAMVEHANIVVGRNLYEFLSLGCEMGYDPLEELAYNPANALAWIRDPALWYRSAMFEPDDNDFIERSHQLSVLREAFGLEPWRNVEARLFQLQVKFLPLLQLSEKFKASLWDYNH